jgi:prepilin-type N-terminal cleavage/methylation domain-containing protein
MDIKHINFQNGFTLVEIMVAAGIFLIISAIMLSFFIHSSDVWQLVTTNSDLRAVARNAMSYMAQELRNATRTSSENPSPNLSIPRRPNNSSIAFCLPVDIDGNGYIIDSVGKTEWDINNVIQYQCLAQSRQLSRLEKGNRYIIANDVASVEFEDNSINQALYNNELKIILTLQKLTPQRRSVSVTLVSIVKLRN